MELKPDIPGKTEQLVLRPSPTPLQLNRLSKGLPLFKEGSDGTGSGQGPLNKTPAIVFRTMSEAETGGANPFKKPESMGVLQVPGGARSAYSIAITFLCAVLTLLVGFVGVKKLRHAGK